MSLKKCKECSREVSTKADKCPGCGAPLKRQNIGCGGAIVIVGAALVIGFIVSDRDYSPPQSAAPPDPALAARGACRVAVTRSLNDPKSAEFEPGYEWPVEVRADGTTRVQPRLRAKNAFGATIYTVWDCEVRHEGENVRVTSIRQISP